jgi:aldose 1-epimerase
MADRYTASQEGDVHILRDSANQGEARISASRGNNVTHFRVAPPGESQPVDVFLPPQGESGLGPSGYAAGNPILFPFPNRVRGGKYSFGGKDHQLDVNETARGNHIHGLVSGREWKVDGTGASDAEGAWHRASYRMETDANVFRQYPFPSTITVTTRLRDGVLEQVTEVRNTGTEALPMGYGTHPWFPATLGGAREATEVKVPGNRYWKLETLVPTGETVDVTTDPGKFDLRQWHALNGNEYDDVFTDLVRRPDGWSEAGIRYPERGLQLIVEAGPEFREWVIFSPLGRPVVCLEPYTGTTNAVNLQAQGVDAGLVVVQPGATWQGTIRTFLRRDA